MGQNNPDAIFALARAGADIEEVYRGEVTPLCLSTSSTSYYAAMLALLSMGANLHARCRYTEMTALHAACEAVDPDAADLLLRWGADETAVDQNGRTPAAVIPRMDEAPEEHRPAILRLVKLLEFADQDRTWRRRGLLVMCRAHPDRLRLVADVFNNITAGFVGEPREGRNCRARREEERVETTTGGGGLGSGSRAQAWSTTRLTGSVGMAAESEAGSDGVIAWLTTQTEEGVFRNIVQFL